MQILVRILLFVVLLALANCQGFLGAGKGPLDPGKLTDSLQSVVETAAKIKEAFIEFKTTFKKSYLNPEEEKKSFETFTENFKLITDFAKDTTSSFKLKLNELADLTVEEFNKLLNGLKLEYLDALPQEEPEVPKVKRSNDKKVDIPKTLDWREKGAVLPARNQGRCGSCYAFAADGALEALFFKQNETLEYLSTQEIVDCARNLYLRGCNGGVPHFAFDYVKDRGINTESEYKYEGKEGNKCQKKPQKTVKVKGSKYMLNSKDQELEEAVSTIGPIIVSIDANARSFQFYSEGIYYEPKCNPAKVNHAVLLVGYGAEANGDKYWLIKNSYGTSWGMNGFGKIAKNVTNHCGINVYAAYAY